MACGETEQEHEQQQRPEQPAPGEEYNAGAPTPPRQAATVILLRGGARALEVLLVKRNPAARFMGGVWVFPGGAVDAEEDARDARDRSDARGERDSGGGERSGERGEGSSSGQGHEDGKGGGDRAHRAAAIRELREEASIALADPDALVKFSRWITPAEVKTRYDTHFFLAPMPVRQEPRVDGEECVDLGWFTPAGALDAQRTGEIALVFPTIKHLEQLSAYASADDALARARARERTVAPVLPRVVVDGDSARVLLPGEPGY